MLNNFKGKKQKSANLLFFTNSSPYGFVRKMMKKLGVPARIYLSLEGKSFISKISGLGELQVPSPKVFIPLWSSLGWMKNWQLIVLGTGSGKDLLPALN